MRGARAFVRDMNHCGSGEMREKRSRDVLQRADACRSIGELSRVCASRRDNLLQRRLREVLTGEQAEPIIHR
jgi:hypothetical protein